MIEAGSGGARRHESQSQRLQTQGHQLPAPARQEEARLEAEIQQRIERAQPAGTAEDKLCGAASSGEEIGARAQPPREQHHQDPRGQGGAGIRASRGRPGQGTQSRRGASGGPAASRGRALEVQAGFRRAGPGGATQFQRRRKQDHKRSSRRARGGSSATTRKRRWRKARN